MQKYYNILKTVDLFKDIEECNYKLLLGCLGAEIKDVEKSEVILLTGDKPRNVGIVVSGRLHIIREDFDGNRSLVAIVNQGEIFAEALCCAGVGKSPVTVLADEKSTVMCLRFDSILRICPHSCSFHYKLIENMLHIVANKNLFLQSRMEIIELKSIRLKVLRYLENLALKQGHNITIPLNREELADYLCTERSALSHELSRMKRDGVIDYRKNHFVLCNYDNK